jgi:hypothetical protein
MKEEKKSNKTIKILIIFVIFMIPLIILKNNHRNSDEYKLELKNDKKYDSLSNLIGKRIPYEKLGETETLDGTNGKYWVCYVKNSDFTFQSRKSDDIILLVYLGKKNK